MLSKIDKELNEKLITCSKFVKIAHGNFASQSKIIEILVRNEGELSQKKMQDQLGIKSGSMSEIIIKMENKGLVERTRSEKDRRSVVLKLTEKGKEIYRDTLEAEHDSDTLFVALSRKEKTDLSELLGRLIDSWKDISPDFIGHKRTHHGHKK